MLAISVQAQEGILPPAQEELQVWPALSAVPPREGVGSMQEEGKSPRRAFLFSALLPGAGEFYAGAEKRAVVFAGIEVIALGIYFTWNGKGNDVEKEFRAMADTSWSPLDYLAWRVSTRASRYSSITHALPCSSFVESGGSLRGCDGRETQQYYELIGKYDQFVSGWEDVVDRTGNRVEPTDIDSVENFSSQLRLVYEVKRDDSNKYLKRASNVLGLILVNHALSAIDAARAARISSQGKSAALEKRARFAVVLPPQRRTPLLVMYKPFY